MFGSVHGPKVTLLRDFLLSAKGKQLTFDTGYFKI